MRARTFFGSTFFIGCLAAAVCTLGAAGQEMDDPERSSPYQPEMLAGPEPVLDLLQTVRLTLANDPNLILSTEDWRFQFGVMQERSGAFDWVLSGDFSFDHREQELQESVIRDEVQRRAELEIAMDESCRERDETSQKLDELLALQGGERTGVSDPIFDTELQLLDSVIRALAAQGADTSEAEAARAAAIQVEVDATRLELLGLERLCRETTDDLARIGDVPRDEEFDIGRLDLRLAKLTRSGVIVAPFLRGSYDSTQFVGKSNGFFEPFTDLEERPVVSPSGIPLERLIDFGGKNQRPVYNVELGFEVNVPLLRNRGRAAVAAPEEAARIDWEASTLLLEHAASVSVLNSVVAHWSLLAAQQAVCVQESSVALEDWVVEITERLVEAEELPRAELSRALAAQANARARLQSARGNLVGARLGLARTVGLTVIGEQNAPLAADRCGATAPAASLCRELGATGAVGGERLDELILPPQPCTPFPAAPSREEVRQAAAGLTDRALDNRYDLEATRRLVESGRVLSEAALVNVKPLLDLSVAAWATGRGENTFNNAVDNWVAPSWKVGAKFEKPQGNNAALGRLRQQESQLRRREITEADLERLIRLAVVRTEGTLLEALDQLDYASSAARSFEEAVRAELLKLREGETTLVDVILTEQQRTDALLAEIQARSQVASLLARLRFESGTLVEREEAGNRITRGSLVSLPGAEGGS